VVGGLGEGERGGGRAVKSTLLLLLNPMFLVQGDLSEFAVVHAVLAQKSP
jgi:hypothetical protein